MFRKFAERLNAPASVFSSPRKVDQSFCAWLVSRLLSHESVDRCGPREHALDIVSNWLSGVELIAQLIRRVLKVVARHDSCFLRFVV